MRALLASALSVLMLLGCGDNDKCTSHTHTYCHEGATYWLDSCGNLEDVKEYCTCGCKPDRSGCIECECSCSGVSACCDGCLPINQDSVCDDGDTNTINDICQEDGTCLGWNPAVAPPEPVRLRSWTCPEGWRSVEHEELLDENGDPLSWCEPPPLPRLKVEDYITPLEEGEQEGDRPTCEPAVDGTYPVLGHSTCQPLGDPCPAGEWPAIPADVTGMRIYVRAGAVGGSGTQAAPFGTIADAVAASASGDVVVLAAGVYAESVTISKDLILWGSCVQQSVIDAPGPHLGWEAGAVEVAGGTQVSLRNLRVSGAQNGVWVNSSPTTVSLRGVWIHKATRQGLVVDAGSANATQVLIDSTLSDEEGINAWGLSVWFGAHAQIKSTTIERNRSLGIVASESGTVLSLEDVAVLNTLSQESDQKFGMGMLAWKGTQVTLTRVLFHGNREVGVFTSSNGTHMSLSDVAILNTQSRESDLTAGWGLSAAEGVQLELARGLFRGNRENAISISLTGTLVSFEDVAVLDTQSREIDNTVGLGLAAQSGARLTLTRGLFQGNRGVGIAATDRGTLASLEDLAVLDSQSLEADLSDGWGLLAGSGAELTLTRGLIQGNREVGIGALHGDTVVSIEDVTVLDTQSQESDLLFGRGLIAQEGVQVTLKRGLFQGNREVGIGAFSSGTLVSLEDVTVMDTRSQESDLMGGIGLHAQDGARVTLTRGLIQRNRETGISAFNDGTLMSLNQVSVKETLKRECALLPDTDPLCCQGYGAGTGLGSYLGASISIEAVEVSDSNLAGLMLARLGSATGQWLTVRRNPIGINIQEVPEGYDFFEAVSRLWVEDNQVNFDTTDLPVPDPLEMIEE